MSELKITIVTAVYNGEKYIEECIKSIMNQTYQNFEKIINNLPFYVLKHTTFAQSNSRTHTLMYYESYRPIQTILGIKSTDFTLSISMRVSKHNKPLYHSKFI